MKSFRTLFTSRNTICVVLVVWLFGIASGIANACLLEDSDAHRSGLPVPHVTAHEAAGQPTALHVNDEGAGHEDHADASKHACLQVCDEGSHALVDLHPDVHPNDPGLALITTLVWTVSDLGAPSFGFQGLLHPIESEQPVRLRFSRLTL